MGRSVSVGLVGNESLAGIQARATTISTVDNSDIGIDPLGTGKLSIDSDIEIRSQNRIRFADADSSNWVSFRSPAVVASNLVWTLPSTDGTANQALTSNGSGVLSWFTPSVSITNELLDSSTYYPLLTTATTGNITTARVSSTNLTYVPSTSTLALNGTANSLRTENVITSGRSLELTDRDRVVACNNTSSITVTIPLDSTTNFPVGSIIYIARVNTGTVQLAAAVGVTVSTFRALPANLPSNEEIFVRKRAANSWIAYAKRGLTYA